MLCSGKVFDPYSIREYKMKDSLTFKTNWKVSIGFSAFVSAFGVINNSQLNIDGDYTRLFTIWVQTFLFLLISWYINSYLTLFFKKPKYKIRLQKKVFIIIVCNAVFLSIFILLNGFILKEINLPYIGKTNVYLFFFRKGIFSISLIYIFQYALNSNAKAQEVSLQNQMLKTENIRAQFEILRQQVNPHFLFNALSTLRSMIRSNNKNSEVFVLKLAEIYRQLLLKREKEVVTLKEELDFVSDYSFMLFARFEEMLSIRIEIPDNVLILKLPTFSLQLLLENCIKHNVISHEKPLKIKIFYTSTDSIIVENNLQPKLSQSAPSGFGLQNLEQRYSLLGISDGIHVFSDESVFRVKIKLLSA
jgi:two-component system, LytTR family, sensor kinase